MHPEWGGSITYGRDLYFNNGYYFVVSWNNVPDDNGDPQTFQLLIGNRQGWSSSDFHNGIFFQYKNITKSYPTTIGVEDQVGNKGTAYDYNNLHNEACLIFSYPISGYRLERLTIKLTKSDSNAKIGVEEDDTGGYNVKLKDYTNPYEDDFKFAIRTAASLALFKAGIIWKCVLILADLAGVLAGDLSPIKPEYTKDALEGDSEAWVYGDCYDQYYVEDPIYSGSFDSTLATTVLWKFIDANDKDHVLTITAEAMYAFGDDVKFISTSATLNMYINSPPNTPSQPSGPTYGCVGASYTYSASTTDPDGDSLRYLFYWGDGSYTLTGWYTSGATASASHSWSSTGYKSVLVRAADSWAWSGWSSILTVYIGSGGGGDLPCPTLFAWNGTGYVDYGVIDIHNPTGEDVVREVPIIKGDVCVNSYKAKFRLREGWEGLNFSESVVDQVKLYAVDKNGKRYLCPLMSATHSTLGNVLPQLLASDDIKAQMLLLETIDLTFTVPYPTSQIQGYVFVIEGCNMYKC